MPPRPCHLLICAIFGIVASLPQPAARGAAADVGQSAPTLVVTQLDGQELNLAALRGHVVILNLWATWCAPCRAEMPMLDAFYRKHRHEGVSLLGLSVDDLRDRNDVAKVMRGLSYPSALLQEATTNTLGMPAALPITYVIDSLGIIRARFLPRRTGLTEQDLDAAVLPLMTASAQAGTP